MRRLVLTIGSLALLGLLPGCESSVDRLIEEQIALINEMADAYENDAPQATIDEIQKRIEENDKKLKDLKLIEENKRKFIRKHKEELDQANERFYEAKQRYEKRLKSRNAGDGKNAESGNK